MKKILVIGSGGAGKSTFSRRLHEITGIELIHLDQIQWQPNWVKMADEEWEKKLAEQIKKDSWIMDGNYSRTMSQRFEACDTIIFLDIPRAVCVWRVTKRFLTYRRTVRPDMAEGCDEKLDFEFLKWIWDYPKQNTPKIEKLLKQFEGEKQIYRFKSNREIEDFLAKTKRIIYNTSV